MTIQFNRKRSCGGCSECCRVFGVPSVKKPAWRLCKHQCADGCAIYAIHPTECRDFMCAWLFGHLDEGDRPDKLGLIFAKAQPGPHESWIHVLEIKPGTFDSAVARNAIRRIAGLEVDSDLEIVLYGHDGIVMHRSDLELMEDIVEEFRDKPTTAQATGAAASP